MAEVDRFGQTSPLHPEQPFVEARIRFAAGQVDRAAASSGPRSTPWPRRTSGPIEGTPTVVSDIAAAANVFAYQGDLISAAKALDLAEQVRREVVQHAGGEPKEPTGRVVAPGDAGRPLLGGRGAGLVAPPGLAERRRSRHGWRARTSESTSPTAARPPPSASSPASPATAAPWSSTGTMSGDPLSREVRALLALSRGDSVAARRRWRSPTPRPREDDVAVYTRPLAAQAYYLLGDYQTTLRMLQDFQPAALYTGGFDSRWGMLGRVRLLRAAAYEQLGRRAEAREEYREALAQWKSADAGPAAVHPAGPAGAGPAGAGVTGRSKARSPSLPGLQSHVRPSLATRYISPRWSSAMVAGRPRGRLEESPSSIGQTAR